MHTLWVLNTEWKCETRLGKENYRENKWGKNILKGLREHNYEENYQ